MVKLFHIPSKLQESCNYIFNLCSIHLFRTLGFQVWNVGFLILERWVFYLFSSGHDNDDNMPFGSLKKQHFFLADWRRGSMAPLSRLFPLALLVAVLLPTVTANHGCDVKHLVSTLLPFGGLPHNEKNKGTFNTMNKASLVCLKKANAAGDLSPDVGPDFKTTCCQTVGLGACAAGA